MLSHIKTKGFDLDMTEKELLENIISEGKSCQHNKAFFTIDQYKDWRNRAQEVISAIYGADSNQMTEFVKIGTLPFEGKKDFYYSYELTGPFDSMISLIEEYSGGTESID